MADAQYVIDVAAQVSGVSATSAELDSLASKLSGNGAKAAMFDDALARLTGELDSARAATSAANSALADGTSRYGELESAAVKAAKAVEKIEADVAAADAAQLAAQARLDEARAAGASAAEIAKYSKQVEKATASTVKAVKAARGLGSARESAASAEQAARGYASELDRLAKEADDAAASQKKLESTLRSTAVLQRRVNDRVGDAATNLSTFRGALGDIGGPIGEFAERLLYPAQAFVDLNEKFGRGTASAVVAGFGLARVVTAVAAAFAAMATAVVAGVAAIASFALVSSDAARKVSLLREATALVTPALRGIPWGDITRATGVADDRLRALSTTLVDVGVAAEELPAALRAVATAEAALGQGGADKFVADLRAGKIAVSELASTVETKFGGIVARQMLGLEAQGSRLKQNISGLFTFEDIDPALKALADVVALFDKNSASGKAMRAALKGVMDPIIENARAAGWAVEAFVLGFLIGAAKIVIAVKPVVARVGELLGIDASSWTLEEVLDKVARAGEKLAPVVAVVAGALAILGAGVVAQWVTVLLAAVHATWLLVDAVVATVQGYGRLAGVVAAASSAIIGAVRGLVDDAIAALSDAVSAFTSIGSNLVQGLASGITGAGGAVIAAITGVVGGAISTAKSLLGISSPSRVFGSIGENTGEGFVQSVERKRPAAQQAIAAMVDSEEASKAASVSTHVSPGRSSLCRATTTNNNNTTSVSTSSTSQPVVQNITITRLEVSDPAAFRAWLEGVALEAT